MSSDPILALILLGLELDEFSMSPVSIPQIKKLIRSVSFKEAEKVANTVLKLSTGEEVNDLSRKRLQELAPDILSDEGSKSE